jgi:hypothetical protein
MEVGNFLFFLTVNLQKVEWTEHRNRQQQQQLLHFIFNLRVKRKHVVTNTILVF